MARVGSVAYTLKLPEGSWVHPTFHISLLKSCVDPSITPVHLLADFWGFAGTKEPAQVLDSRIIQKRWKAVTEVLIRWQGETAEDALWELWQDLQRRYPKFLKTTQPWGQG